MSATVRDRSSRLGLGSCLDVIVLLLVATQLANASSAASSISAPAAALPSTSFAPSEVNAIVIPSRSRPAEPPINPLEELHYALETMQKSYFELFIGTWPDCIDWTAAVMGTYLSATLFTLTRSLGYIMPTAPAEGARIENEINKYFTQSMGYYFGENAFAIRTQAYDDMLWVVLGWLESVKFIQAHSRIHYPGPDGTDKSDAWYGQQFVPALAHRSRVFYDLASRGWDTEVCGGGMVWNGHLRPYKNAITNQLYIAASVGMYLHFTGDDNDSPFVVDGEHFEPLGIARQHDPKYLRNAVEAYEWLVRSNMTNELGLFVDGYHIKGYGVNGTKGTGKCDVRNEMVYTYNQGVLLSGLRGIWEGTGRTKYLEDGHALVRSVIAATGFDIDQPGKIRAPDQWAGLGRNGILEEICDSSGRCNQDGQIFKGIYFHHLTHFCEPLPAVPLVPGLTFTPTPEIALLHSQSCKEYTAWVAHNGRAALEARDGKGKFGMWWGSHEARSTEIAVAPLPDGAQDYRNNDTSPFDEVWGPLILDSDNEYLRAQQPTAYKETRRYSNQDASDPNDRGRGRTPETQGSGVAVLRAFWEFVKMYRHE